MSDILGVVGFIMECLAAAIAAVFFLGAISEGFKNDRRHR